MRRMHHDNRPTAHAPYVPSTKSGGFVQPTDVHAALMLSSAAVYRDLIALQRTIPKETIRRGILSEEPRLRDLLLRAGAAWLIGYASLLAFLSWGTA